MPGYNGAYRAIVVDANDPVAQGRVQVQVPDVLGDQTAWAAPEETTAATPNVGDEVTVHFENGDEDHPLWRPGTASGGGQDQPAAGYNATYRGIAVNNVDPGGYRRVQVQVPDVSTEVMWAMPESADARLPAIGDEVYVRFENGDVQYPQWSGGSGTGEQPSLDGAHRATVTSLDPSGLGRLYVQVPGITEGVWATPEQAPPGVGEDVVVRFDGDAEHATWTR
jgi:hypothetical protein